MCRRCASLARRSTKPNPSVDPIRKAIKHGRFEEFRDLFFQSSPQVDAWLAIAAGNHNTAPKHGGHERIVDFLIERGAKPDRRTLFESARDGSQELADRLIAGGVEPDIFTCAALGDSSATRTLLHRQPELARTRVPEGIRSYQDFTPLHLCCLSALGRRRPTQEAELLKTARLLADHGADVNATATFYGTLTVTPLDMTAHTGGNLSIAELLIAQGARISSFALGEALAHRGRSLEEGFALAEILLRHGLAINSLYKDGTILHNSANTGNTEVVKWLLERGADIDARDPSGQTPLHRAAARNRSSQTIALLAEWGADLQARDHQGLTPLDIANLHGKTEVARWLSDAETASSPSSKPESRTQTT